MNERMPLIGLTERLGEARVAVVGDVILDHFHYGSVERISPEAPVPVLRLEREDTMLGGAGNVVRNLKALGANPRFATVVGEDTDGREIARLLAREGIADAAMIDGGGRRTSAKSRFMAAGQQVLRTDRETVFPIGPEIERRFIAAALAAVDDVDVVVISDYRKGVLSDAVIRAVIAAAGKASKVVVVDPKGTDYERYRGADLITPNRRELFEATGMAVDDDDAIAIACRHLIDTYGFGAVLATRSGDGMTLLGADGVVNQLKAEAREVFDVSGAGDTVIATVAAALGAGATLEDAARLANVAAGIVVAKIGTAVAFADDVVQALHHQDLSSAEAKVMALKPALDRIDQWRRSGMTVGFTNGCFDLLHPGHVTLLAKAREASGRLVVGLNSDASVRRIKGPGRPIQSEAARATVLASLASVDMVIVFSEDTPLALIEAIRPDVLVKGADYAIGDVVGGDIVTSYGGRVELIALEPGHSTTATIAKLARETR